MNRCTCNAVYAFAGGLLCGMLGLFAVLLALYFAWGFKGWRL